MSSTLSRNGQPRKQLADQLDRLDEILDCLGDGLTGAVVDAMKAGTAIAVKEALIEVLTNSELLAAIRTALPVVEPMAVPAADAPSTLVRPSFWAKLKAKLTAARMATVAFIGREKQRIAAAVKTIRTVALLSGLTILGRASEIKNRMNAFVSQSRVVRYGKRITLLAVGIGTATGVMSLLAPHAYAALTSGVTAAITVVGVQLGFRAPKLWQRVLPALT